MTPIKEITWNGPEALRGSLIAISDLEPWPGNPRQGDVGAISESLKRFGQLRPIVVRGNRIVAGHHVVLAARALGWSHVAVLESELADEREARAFLIADNRTAELGYTDDALLVAQLESLGDRSGTGYSDDDLDDLRATVAALQRLDNPRDPDTVPDPPAKAVSKRGEVYELEPPDVADDERALPPPTDRDWPKQWQRIFLQSLSSLPDVTAACRLAGISKQHAYKVRENDDDFALAWGDALELAHDAVERRAYQWIVTGVPVKKTVKRTKMKEGVVVEEETTTTESAETSATLMIFWLKAHFPDRYRWSERFEATGADGGPIKIEPLSAIDRQIEELSAELASRARQAVVAGGDDAD